MVQLVADVGHRRLVHDRSGLGIDDGEEVRFVDAGAFVATIQCAPADAEPADDYLTLDMTGPVDEAVELALGYIDEMGQ